MAHIPRKRFGQNFLTDDAVISAIIHCIQPRPSNHFVEIGPGLGALTKPLLPLCQQLDVIELDRDLLPGLERLQKSFPHLVIHNQDALQIDLSQLIKDKASIRLIGNLPYNISTPLLFHVLQFSSQIQDMHFMLQKEVVDRLAATQGSAYGRLSIMIQYHCQVEALLPVPAEAFHPAPKVASGVVRLIPYMTPPYPCDDLQLLSDVVRIAFNQRRKTLRNNLRNLLSADHLHDLGIDPHKRPEQLPLKKYVKMANFLYNNRAN